MTDWAKHKPMDEETNLWVTAYKLQPRLALSSIINSAVNAGLVPVSIVDISQRTMPTFNAMYETLPEKKREIVERGGPAEMIGFFETTFRSWQKAVETCCRFYMFTFEKVV